MAEVKNSFLKSKMNQDLDDRLIPNGEYRYANNISVGKSETDDIGALKNVLGNELLLPTQPEYDADMECIGILMDNQNNRMFQFLTNYTDPNPNQITFPEDAPFTEGITEWKMKIAMYTFDGNSAPYVTLVEGLFLNFAKNKQFKITGINLVEGLLFWTDNRNQPRKINISNALNNNNYYTTEEQISVAKYAPVDPITLYKKVITTADGSSSGNILEVTNAAGIVPGMTLLTDDIAGSDFCTVVDVTGTTITFYQNLPITITDDTELTFLISTMSDKSSVPSWPGDPAFLEDKYVRFSYRFKYDDNEYSLMAPFTQIAYIPKQKGYFIAGNETDAYRSTVLNWFENNINNIELIVPFPDKIGNLVNSYKIVEIDILYKESDSTAIKVFETIPISVINTTANTNNNYYIQQYQSQKPYKTLSEDQIVRVYDKVPVRARAQESAGNRIIYGNYYDKYTSVGSINYNVSVQPKSSSGTNFIEYPNHTLKKNRNYQVGFVIADKFGRQSPVILSSGDLPGLDIGSAGFAKGSTIYSSYENSVLFEDVRTWFGDALVLYLNGPIDQQKDIPTGQPGLYAIATSNFGFSITNSIITNTTYTYTLDTTALSNTPPAIGDIMRGFYTDYVKVVAGPTPTGTLNQYVVTTSGRVNDIYKYVNQGFGITDIKFAYKYNPIGWYSYKIVVKQQEQDYYNVYLPGMLNGYPKNQTSGSQVVYSGSGATATSTLQNGINTTQFPVSETGNTSHIVLINDNINKVPRDLSEVGPDQKQYRSSVQLYGRVENTEDSFEIIGVDPAYTAKVTVIQYDSTNPLNENWVLIKPGDGIQCVEASEPITTTPVPPATGGTTPNPYRWLGDTVVVSNVIGLNGIGKITISSPNWVVDTNNPATTYKTFKITRAENKQYFPTRKADTVISIATANEFNFIDNSEDNLSGTAGLNFYQLQNKPLIGRVSTVNKIGVIAPDMIPFLSVYETRATESLLELFWETATTGLISDLNADVLTGFEGPSGFSNVNYKHFEWQDSEGIGEGTGDQDSKYITDSFFVVDQTGYPILDTTVTLVSVFNGENPAISRFNDFGIEPVPASSPKQYRLFIKPEGNFVFNHNADTKESYIFTFNVVDNSDPEQPLPSTLTIAGRLGNSAPIITTVDTDYSVTQNTTAFATLEAINGAYFDPLGTPPLPPTNVKSDLKWSIVSGNTGGYFSIGAYTGILEVNNPLIPLGTYNLVVKVQDAVNTNTGQLLLPTGDFGTLEDTIELNINVGDAPVPYWLRPDYQSFPILSNGSCPSSFGNFYGIAYIGPNPTPSSAYLPVIPGSNSNYQVIENVESVNAAVFGYPEIEPTGLTQGEYRFKIKLTVNAIPICPAGPDDPTTNFANSKGEVEIYLYKRKWNPSAPLSWQLVNNENNFGVPNPPAVLPYKIGPLIVNTAYDEFTGQTNYGQPRHLTTSFTIEEEEDLQEYAVGVRLLGTYQSGFGSGGQSVTFYGNDANYSYPQTEPFSPSQTNDYSYYTGVEEITPDPMIPGYPSGVPYTTLDATRGLYYSSPTNSIASGPVNTGDSLVVVTLNTANQQAANGLSAYIEEPGGFPLLSFGEVVYVNPSNPAEITIQLFSPWNNPSITSLAGKNLRLITEGILEEKGRLYANTEEGTEIKRFYTDPGFTLKWIPPVADRYYNFITVKNYSPDGISFYSEYPYYCAKINGVGEVIDVPPQVPNVQTAWTGQNNANTQQEPIKNYSYNVLYESPPTP